MFTLDNRNDFISRIEFVKILSSEFEKAGGDFPCSEEELFERGIAKGWLQGEDRLFKDSLIERRNCARILHEFMRREMNVTDIEDVSPAYSVKDIFDCHVCTQHIAQVVLRGIMKCDSKNVFGITQKIRHEEAEDMVKLTLLSKM